MKIAGIILTALGVLPLIAFLASVVALLSNIAQVGLPTAMANYALLPVITFPGFAMFLTGVILLIVARGRSPKAAQAPQQLQPTP
ncbi:MAG: hypothetical protein K0Q52_187 [Microbacterium sp.]|jgi:hypothetical protein|nr:hypothetical protein [Microbacterium sp.]